MFTKIELKRIYLNQVISFGFYFYYWCARSGGEVNKNLGKKVALSAWWFLVPFFGAYWWVWNYADGIDQATKRRIKKTDTFLIYILASNLWAGFIYLPFNINIIDLQGFEQISLETIGIVILFLLAIMFSSYSLFCAFIQSKINSLGYPYK